MSSNQSRNSPLTSFINKAYLPADLDASGKILCKRSRLLCVKILGNTQISLSGQHSCHGQSQHDPYLHVLMHPTAATRLVNWVIAWMSKCTGGWWVYICISVYHSRCVLCIGPYYHSSEWIIFCKLLTQRRRFSKRLQPGTGLTLKVIHEPIRTEFYYVLSIQIVV